MISIKLDKAAKRHLKALRDLEKNFDKALALFTQAVATALKVEVQALGRSVEGVDYKDLEVAHFGIVDGSMVSAIIHPESVRALSTELDEWKTVLSFIPKDPADKYQKKIAKGSPWPAEILPDSVRKLSTRLVSRRVTVREVDNQVRRLVDTKDTMELLIRWNLINATDSKHAQVSDLEKLPFPDGLEVYEDVAWRVLRQEFGIGGESSMPHWRRAIDRQGVNIEKELLVGFWEAILGKKSGRLPRKDAALLSKMGGVEKFQNYIGSRGEAQRGNPK